ncbi:MAG: TIR domain-containing protein [Planctomycetaceae bacterium]
MRIFLSHHSDDKSLVREVKQALPEFLQTWLDEDRIRWSDNIAVRLLEAINVHCDFLILFLRAKTLKSKWVQRELRAALRREKELGRTFILPVVLDSRTTLAALPAFLKERLYIEANPGPKQVPRLVEDLLARLFQLVIENNTLGGGLGPDRQVPIERRVLLEALVQGPSRENLWLRPMLRGPLPDEIFDKLLALLKNLVEVVRQHLDRLDRRPGKSTGITRRIRSNIFLARGDAITNGEVGTLSIPQRTSHPTRLAVHMDDDGELAIFFRPSEGATGKAYARQQAVGRITNPHWRADHVGHPPVPRWIDVDLQTPARRTVEATGTPVTSLADTELNEYVNVRVHPQLRWILSVPIELRVGGRAEVIGTFSVDGLNGDLSERQLAAVFRQVQDYSGKIARLLRDLPFEYVAVVKAQDQPVP